MSNFRSLSFNENFREIFTDVWEEKVSSMLWTYVAHKSSLLVSSYSFNRIINFFPQSIYSIFITNLDESLQPWGVESVCGNYLWLFYSCQVHIGS